jgi:putative membrane protein
MRNLLLSFLINAAAIAVITSGLLPGIHIIGNQIATLLAVALIFGVVNTIVKPIIKLLTCPFILLTLGLLLFIINGAMLWLTALLSERLIPFTRGQLYIEHFGWAVLGALIISIIGVALERLLGVNERTRVEKVKEIHYVVERPQPPRSPDAEFEDFINSRPFDDFDDKPKRR